MTDEFSAERVYAELLGRAPENTRSRGSPRRAAPSSCSATRSVPDHPRHGHQRQDLDEPHDRGTPARPRPAHRPLTSPHLCGQRAHHDRRRADSDEALARNWDDIEPYLAMVDAELVAAGERR